MKKLEYPVDDIPLSKVSELVAEAISDLPIYLCQSYEEEYVTTDGRCAAINGRDINPGDDNYDPLNQNWLLSKAIEYVYNDLSFRVRYDGKIIDPIELTNGKAGDLDLIRVERATSYTDKNGKRIYDGDVILFDCYQHEISYMVKYIAGYNFSAISFYVDNPMRMTIDTSIGYNMPQ